MEDDAPDDSQQVAVPPAEALLAAVGIEPFFGDEPVRVFGEQRQQAARIPAVIRRELRRFLTGTEWDRETTLPECRYRRALDALTESVDAVNVADKISRLDPDEAALLVMSAGRCVEYLRQIIPKRSIQTPLGPEPVSPSDADVSAFRRAYGVANRPMSVLEDVNEGTLARDQVRALEAMFPGLYEAIKLGVLEALTNLKANHPKATISHQRSKQLSVLLLDAGAIDQPLAQILQKNFAEKDEGATAEKQLGNGSNKPVQLDAAAEDTPIRRIENR